MSNDYIDFINKGHQYKNAAINGYKTGKFSMSLAYSTILMSLENYLCGLLEKNSIVPLNHTFTDLTDELISANLIESKLALELKEIDKHFNLCSLDPLTMPVIDENLIDGLFKLAEEVNLIL